MTTARLRKWIRLDFYIWDYYCFDGAPGSVRQSVPENEGVQGSVNSVSKKRVLDTLGYSQDAWGHSLGKTAYKIHQQNAHIGGSALSGAISLQCTFPTENSFLSILDRQGKTNLVRA